MRTGPEPEATDGACVAAASSIRLPPLGVQGLKPTSEEQCEGSGRAGVGQGEGHLWLGSPQVSLVC